MTLDCPRQADGWDARYAAGDTPWNLGGPPPALASLLAEPAFAGGGLDVVVPGAGHGHDAVAWARAGHRVTAVDVAPRAAAAARDLAARAGVALEVVLGDVLDPNALPAHAYDVLWEHTCFCAVDPTDQPRYVAAARRLVRPGGLVLALLWNHGQAGGPPHDVTPAGAAAAFQGFALTGLAPVRVAAAGRTGEFLMRLCAEPAP